MKLFLDANICIYLLKQHPVAVFKQFLQYSLSDIGVSSIVVAELQYGVEKSRYRERNQQNLDAFLDPLRIVEFDRAAARQYGKIRAVLARQGQPIGPQDMFIAAHALALGVTLVTNNEREFQRVPGLRVENWV